MSSQTPPPPPPPPPLPPAPPTREEEDKQQQPPLPPAVPPSSTFSSSSSSEPSEPSWGCGGAAAPPRGTLRVCSSDVDGTTNLGVVNRHPRDARIVFDEEPHLYYVDGAGGYTSVTTLIGGLFSHFDAKRVSAMCADRAQPGTKYFGLTAEEIQAQWSAKGQAASAAGTEMHMHIEWYYNGIDVITTKPEPDLTPEMRFFLAYLRDYSHLRAYRTEWCVFDEDLKLAGSIDMVYFNERTQTYAIYDWKRVGDIHGTQKAAAEVAAGKRPRSPGWGALPASARVPDTKLGHYTLQLNTYKYILEKHYGLRVTELALVVLHPDNSNYEVVPLEDWSCTIVPDVVEYRRQILARGPDASPPRRVPGAELAQLRKNPAMRAADIALFEQQQQQQHPETEKEEKEEEQVRIALPLPPAKRARVSNWNSLFSDL